MRKPLKFLILALVLMLIASALIITTLAEEGEAPKKQYSLVYQNGDTACGNDKHDHHGVMLFEEGTVVTVSSTICGNGPDSGETFFGWFSDDGVLYAPGSTFTITRNTTLYVACGKEISTGSALREYLDPSNNQVGSYWNYAKLTANITLDNQQVNADWNSCTTAVIDLNGHTINSANVEYGFGCQRTGLIFTGNGTVNFTSNKQASGAFFNTSIHGYGDGDQRIWIGKGVKIVSNVPLIKLTNSFVGRASLPTIRIHGDITAPYILWSNGASGIDVNLYSTCKITIPSGAQRALLYDGSGEVGFTIANLVIHGGTFNLPNDFKGFVTTIDGEPDDRLTYKIAGGTFNRDVSTLIPISLRVVNNPDGTYSILPNPCSKAPEGSNGLHKYVATQIGVDCDTSGQIHYSCIYCSEASCEGESIGCYCNYIANRQAFGHSFISVLTKDMINNKKETEPAESTLTCTRCGLVEKQYESPDPSTVYITLKVKYTRDVNGSAITYQDTIRVPSTSVFGFKVDTAYGDAATYINSFSITSLKYKFDDGREETIKQHEVVGIEIPLGTTKIQKNLFNGNETIEWIKLREGIMYIEEGVFANMPNLKSIEGIEHIQDFIGANAFSQKDTETPIVLNTIELNAKEVGTNAFKNILAKRIIVGDNVRRLKNAFGLDGKVSKYETQNDVMCEVFVSKLIRDYNPVANPELFEVTVDSSALVAIWPDYFEEFYHSSTLLKRGLVYDSHNYIETTHQPTCKQNGFIAHECSQCGEYEVIEIIPNTGITHTWVDTTPTKSTCMQAGSVRQYCDRCKEYKIIAELPLDPNKHDFSSTDPEPEPAACTQLTWYERRRCAYGCGAWSNNKGKKYTVTVPLGHTYSNDPADIIVVKPTCGNPGQEIKACTRCAEQIITETPANGTHSWVRNDSAYIAPTCGAEGTINYRCTVCEATDAETVEKLTYEQALEKSLHKWTEEIILQPTVKKTGYKRVFCSICTANNRTAQTIIPKLPSELFLGFIPLGTMSATTAWIIFGVIMAVLVGGSIFLVVFLVSKKKNKSTSYHYSFNTFKK